MLHSEPELSRRRLLAGGAGLAASAILGPIPTGGVAAAGASAGGWYVPADDVPHERTWMAWPARRDIWGSLLPGVRDDITRIARAIANHEPVSLIVRPDQAAGAAAACGPTVDIVQLTNDDLWMRDIGPVFLVNDCGGLAGLDLNFNGWGNKQVHTNDANIADEVLSLLGLDRFNAPFTSEGGALEFDGDGTAIATESSIRNPNRNPGQSKAQLTKAIRDYTGATKLVWVPGLRGRDITDDHIDSLAVFVKPGSSPSTSQPTRTPPTHGQPRRNRPSRSSPPHPTPTIASSMPRLPRVTHHPPRTKRQPVRQRLRQLVRSQRRRLPARLQRPQPRRRRPGTRCRALTQTVTSCSYGSTTSRPAAVASTAPPNSNLRSDR